MAIYVPVRLVRETDTEVEYVYALSDEELVDAPRSLIVAKAGREDPDRWDLRLSHPGDEATAVRALRAATRSWRENGDPRWPRGGAYCA